MFIGVGIFVIRLVPLPQRLNIRGSRVVAYADGKPMCVYLSADEKWLIPVDIKDVDPHYIAALIRFEDKRFYRHIGVDPIALIRAFFQNMKARRVVSGASTVTMQLVRILEPRPRTIRSKIIEMFRAIQLECRFSKREILEHYLQFLPFGTNLEGVEAASLAYFGHRSKDLSPFEIAYLLSVPQDPPGRYPSPGNAKKMPAVLAGISDRLRENGIFSDDEAAEVKRTQPPDLLKPFPRDAMHVAQYLSSRYPDMWIQSTIRQDAQAIAVNALDTYRREFESMGIYNAAAVVLDEETSKVVAAVGNFDFWDTAHQGQVIGFMAPRSPGSAMKPFIYALAINKGIALPDYLVADIPVRYSGYEPINYDRKFRGLIRLEEALSYSLNIPFVNLLHQVGLPDYLEFLHQAGLTTLVDVPGYYGLSIAIGACEVRPAELANMYAMLGRNGKFMELVWKEDYKPAPPKQLLAPGAAYLTRQTLRIRDRPDFPERRAAVPLAPEIFWKTGTSGYHRDAWSLGGTSRYIAGVWAGNFDGTPSRYLVGAETAAPILFDILEGLSHENRGEFADRQTPDLVPVEVCTWSGRLASRYCPSRKTVLGLQSHMPQTACRYHVEYIVDAQTGYRLNPLCMTGHKAVPRVFTVLPASTRRWIDDNQFETPAPPPNLPGCPHVAEGEGPSILSPKPNMVYFLVPGLKPEQQEIPLEAEAGSDVGELYWFVDGRFLSESAPHERVWLTPTVGTHELRVQDATGKSDAIHIQIMPPG